MNSLIERMKRLLVLAIKRKEIERRDILRLVISDVETDFKRKEDEKWAESVVRKHLKQIDESLAFYKEGDEGHTRLTVQAELLNKFLPKTLSVAEIENTLRMGSCATYEAITGASNDGQAVGIAMQLFKAEGHNVLGKDVKEVVAKIRS